MQLPEETPRNHIEAIDQIYKELKGKYSKEYIENVIDSFFGRYGLKRYIRIRKNVYIPYLGNFVMKLKARKKTIRKQEKALEKNKLTHRKKMRKYMLKVIRKPKQIVNMIYAVKLYIEKNEQKKDSTIT